MKNELVEKIKIKAVDIRGINNTFTTSQLIEIMEAARVALNDADTFDYLAEELDLADEYLYELRDKLQNYLDNARSI